MKNLMFCIGFISLANLTNGQKRLEEFYKKNIEIKKSFDNKIDEAKAAALNFAIPAGAKNYYTINGGIAIRAVGVNTSSLTKLDVFGVYNKNNQISKEQDNFKLGITIQKWWLFFKEDGLPRQFKLSVSFANEYLHNKIDTTHSFLSLLYLSPLFKIANNIKVGMPVDGFGKNRWIPLFKIIPGIEYQNKFNVSKGNTSGSIMRSYLSSSFDLYYRIYNDASIVNPKLVNLFQTSIGYTFRKDFKNTTNKQEGYLPLLDYVFSFYPFKNDNVFFSAHYLNGSDPVNGLDKQEYWQFEFKFKKNIL